VYRGNTVFEKDVLNKISNMVKNIENKRSYKDYNLTEREFDILKLIGEGFSNKEIAEKLYLGEGTVRNYVTLLLDKLGLRDRTQLAIFYLKNLNK
ncbi:MAG TPA: DNA-binding response regulator, partial [Clostridiaceae bacterium]|nr:DNA-binding response regulator [Clostridiaceae bacterium]